MGEECDMREKYETLKVDFPGLPEELKVPRDAVHRGETILQRFYEPNQPGASVPEREIIDPHSVYGRFRSPEFCYGFKAPVDDRPTIVGKDPVLDSLLDSLAQDSGANDLCRECVKVYVARRLAEAYEPAAEHGDEEAAVMISELDSAVDKAFLKIYGFAKDERYLLFGR